MTIMSDFERKLLVLREKIHRDKNSFSNFNLLNVPSMDKYIDLIRNIYENNNTDPQLREAIYYIIVGSATEIEFLENAMKLAVGIE